MYTGKKKMTPDSYLYMIWSQHPNIIHHSNIFNSILCKILPKLLKLLLENVYYEWC